MKPVLKQAGEACENKKSGLPCVPTSSVEYRFICTNCITSAICSRAISAEILGFPRAKTCPRHVNRHVSPYATRGFGDSAIVIRCSNGTTYIPRIICIRHVGCSTCEIRSYSKRYTFSENSREFVICRRRVACVELRGVLVSERHTTPSPVLETDHRGREKAPV